jgi:hypothetical protein
MTELRIKYSDPVYTVTAYDKEGNEILKESTFFLDDALQAIHEYVHNIAQEENKKLD